MATEQVKRMQGLRTWAKMTEPERKAVAEKCENPSEDVHCPNCGEPISYFERGNSYGARCNRCNYEDGVRGVNHGVRKFLKETKDIAPFI